MKPRTTIRAHRKLNKWIISVGGDVVGRVCPVGHGGWYFSVRSLRHKIPEKNTAAGPLTSEADAIRAALAYVRGCLAAAEKDGAS